MNEDLSVANPEWTNWRWQYRNRMTSETDLQHFMGAAVAQGDAAAMRAYLRKFRVGITPYLFSLVERDRGGQILWGSYLGAIQIRR